MAGFSRKTRATYRGLVRGGLEVIVLGLTYGFSAKYTEFANPVYGFNLRKTNNSEVDKLLM